MKSCDDLQTFKSTTKIKHIKKMGRISCTVKMRCSNTIVLLTVLTTCLCYKADMLKEIDPVTARDAISCMENIIKYCFKYTDDYSKFSSHTNQSLLLTFMTSRDMEHPAEEIQDHIMKEINLKIQWQVEVIERERFSFDSYEYCVKHCKSKHPVTKRKFVPKVKSYFYIIIADGEENVFNKLEAMSQLSTFNPKGTYLIFYTPKTCNSDLIASTIYEKLNDLNIYRAYLMVSVQFSRAKIKIYAIALDQDNQVCGKFELRPIAFCTEGHIDTRLVTFNISEINDFKNCELDVITSVYEPFVIDDHSGFEMDVLHLIGKSLNISFNVAINNETNDWGSKSVTGHWNGSLGEIYNTSSIGIGNIGPSYLYIEDFDFTNSYFMEDLVVAAPTAGFVPKWRVLFSIFTYEMWLIILGVIILCAILIYITARYFKDFLDFRVLHIDFIVSLQLLLCQSLVRLPMSDPTRVVVIAMTIFAMITSAVYTSYMINVLTNPVREAQLASLEDIISSGMSIGGLEIYKEIFREGDDEVSQELFEKYATDDELDQADDWLKEMSFHRNTCTVLSKFYTNFLIANKSHTVYDKQGHIKIFIFPKKLLSYYVSIVMRKGFPLIPKINFIISRLTVGGLQNKLASNYVPSMKKVASIRDDISSQTLELTIDHVQGAFAILAFGYMFSLIAFVVEYVLQKYRKRNKKKKQR